MDDDIIKSVPIRGMDQASGRLAAEVLEGGAVDSRADERRSNETPKGASPTTIQSNVTTRTSTENLTEETRTGKSALRTPRSKETCSGQLPEKPDLTKMTSQLPSDLLREIVDLRLSDRSAIEDGKVRELAAVEPTGELHQSEHSAGSSSVVGAHRVRGIQPTYSSREFEKQASLSNVGGTATMDDNAGGTQSCSSALQDISEATQDMTDVTLVTAAEVVDDSSEEFRRKSAEMEEEIKQRIISSAVEANVLALPVVEENGEEKKIMPQRHSAAKGWIIWFAAAAVLILVVVVLLATLLTRDTDRKDSDDAALEMLFPPDDTVIAQVSTTICYERVPLFGSSQVCPEQELGSAATNLVAASRLWNFPQADMAILNAGEVKTDIEPGNFTVLDAKSVLPYPNTLVILQIPGKKLLIVLERALQKLVDDYSLLELNETMSGGPYPYGAGIRFQVNMSETFPKRLSHVEINPQLAEEVWLPIADEETYSIVTNSFLAGGGDGYAEFARLPPEAYNDTGLHTLSAFIEYSQATKTLEEPPLEQFSTQAFHNNMYNWSCDCQKKLGLV